MLIQYASDLHLEFSVNKKYLDRHFLKPAGNILLLAGDVVPFAKMSKAQPLLQRLSDNYEHVYWIAGNHEYYYADIPSNVNPANSFEEKILANVTLLNNRTIELDNVRIVFSTFWSHIDKTEMSFVQKGMADFSLITENKIPISCEQYNTWHSNAFCFVRNETIKPTQKKTIVVTHHVPTFRQYPGEFLNSPINAGFATEYDSFIEKSNIDYWIFGHHHRNMAPLYIGKTQLLTNQLGYIWHQENSGFDDAKTIFV